MLFMTTVMILYLAGAIPCEVHLVAENQGRFWSMRPICLVIICQIREVIEGYRNQTRKGRAYTLQIPHDLKANQLEMDL